MNKTSMKELLYSFAASLVFASAGALLAWPAATLPRLTASPPLEAPALSSAQGSWCVAALHAGQVLGAVPGAVLAARAGRRVALLACAPPLAAAWLLLAWAGALGDAGVWGVAGARALGGVAVGVAFVAGPLYAAEAASARLRGAAGALVQLALSAGQLLAYCGGAWLSLRQLALAAAALPVVFAAAFWWAPESPHWLLRRGKRQRAERALRTLRGSKVAQEAIEEELAQLEIFACAEAVDVAERGAGVRGYVDEEAAKKFSHGGVPNTHGGNGDHPQEEAHIAPMNIKNPQNSGERGHIGNGEVSSSNFEARDETFAGKSNSSDIKNIRDTENSDVNITKTTQSFHLDNVECTFNEDNAEGEGIANDGPNSMVKKGKASSISRKPIPFVALFRDDIFRRTFLLLLALVLLQSFGSATFLFPYTTHVLNYGPLSPDTACVVLGSTQLLGSLASPWLLASRGRRPALLASASLAALACAARVICLRLLPSPTAAFTALCVAAFAGALAFLHLPLALAAELAPAAARGAVVAAAAAIGAAGSYAAQRAYEALWLGGAAHVASYASTACCGVAAWLAFALLPEVHGLTLLEAQRALSRDLGPPRIERPKRTPLETTASREQQPPPPLEEETVVIEVKVGRFRLAFVRRERVGNGVPLQAVGATSEMDPAGEAVST